MTSRPTTRVAVAVAGFALFAASCSGGSDAADPAPSDEAAQTPISAAPTDDAAEATADATVAPTADTPVDTAAAPVDATVAVPAALQFSAPLVGGGEIDASTLAGKPTAFWFWAPT